MVQAKPTIRGIFVNSHIKAVERRRGAAGLRALQKCYGGPLRFTNSQNVPVREEVKILTCAVPLLRGDVPEDRRDYEAGKLHFENFSTTPFARILLKTFRRRFKTLMLRSSSIAEHVFRGVRFTAENLGVRTVRITLENNDYPLDHFRGLFAGWMAYSRLHGRVTGERDDANRFIYTIRWQ